MDPPFVSLRLATALWGRDVRASGRFTAERRRRVRPVEGSSIDAVDPVEFLEARRTTPLPELITRFRKAVRLGGVVRLHGRIVTQLSFEYPEARKAASLTRLLSEQLAEASGALVLEPANVPAAPLYPNHKTISFAGFVGGLALGLPISVVVGLARRRATSGRTPLV